MLPPSCHAKLDPYGLALENYDLLREIYEQLLGQRNRELGHVANLIGGTIQTNFWFPQGTKVFTPVPAEQQKKAVQFLLETS